MDKCQRCGGQTDKVHVFTHEEHTVKVPICEDCARYLSFDLEEYEPDEWNY